jgi:hypothetical protein
MVSPCFRSKMAVHQTKVVKLRYFVGWEEEIVGTLKIRRARSDAIGTSIRPGCCMSSAYIGSCETQSRRDG